MKKHIGSFISIIIGVLFIITGLSQFGVSKYAIDIFFSGVVIILGALFYIAQKKRQVKY